MNKPEAHRGPTKQQERAERILDAAADLLLRWGYKRVTIEDIATQTGIGKGTIYLHWKTKDALFGALLLREAMAIWQALFQQVRADPAEARFSRLMRALLLITARRPLARALFTGDRELLGKLARSGIERALQSQQMITSQSFVALLRDQGLLRDDTDIAAQIYAIQATVTGFFLIEPALAGEDRLSLEQRADALAQTVKRAFEPEDVPPEALHAIIAHMSEWLAQLSAQKLSEKGEFEGQAPSSPPLSTTDHERSDRIQ